MKRLGLGEPITHAPVSEAAALEQASDFVQQLVLFSYSVGVFASYYFYTKLTAEESLKLQDYLEFKEQQERVSKSFRFETQLTHFQAIKELRLQVESLEQRLAAQQKRNFFSQLGFGKDDEEPPKSTSPKAPESSELKPADAKPSESLKQRFQRISSLPIDAAASLILDGTCDD